MRARRRRGERWSGRNKAERNGEMNKEEDIKEE